MAFKTINITRVSMPFLVINARELPEQKGEDDNDSQDSSFVDNSAASEELSNFKDLDKEERQVLEDDALAHNMSSKKCTTTPKKSPKKQADDEVTSLINRTRDLSIKAPYWCTSFTFSYVIYAFNN